MAKIIIADAQAVSAMKAQGEALADLFNKEVQNQAVTLKRYMQDLFVLSLEGRQAFRVKMESIRKEWARLKAEKKGTRDESYYQKVIASAGVRVSEAVTISKAFDAGYNVHQWDTESYHTIVAKARRHLESAASAGPTNKRGRKAKESLEKAKEYLAKLEFSADDIGELLAFVQAGCKVVE